MEKPIKDHPYYYATDKGDVISYRKGYRHVLKQQPNSKGYLMVKLGRGKTFSVHRLIATSFIPNELNKPQVNHKNEVITDNRVENLEWVTVSQNNNYGNHNKNISRSIRKNSYLILAYNKKGDLLKFETIAEVSRNIGIHAGSICEALNGKRNSAGGYTFKYSI